MSSVFLFFNLCKFLSLTITCVWRMAHVIDMIFKFLWMKKTGKFLGTFFPPKLLNDRVAEKFSNICNARWIVHDFVYNILEFFTCRIIVNVTTFVHNDKKLRPMVIIKLFSYVKSLKNIKIKVLGLFKIEFHALIVVWDTLCCYPMLSHPGPKKPHHHFLLVIIFKLNWLRFYFFYFYRWYLFFFNSTLRLAWLRLIFLSDFKNLCLVSCYGV